MTPKAPARAVFRAPRPRPVPTAAALLLLLLGGCATSGQPVVTRYPAGGAGASPPAAEDPATGSALDEAERAAARGDHDTASRQFAAAAATAPAPQSADYRLRAAESALAARNPVRADQLLDLIPAPTSSTPADLDRQARYRLLRARTALARNDPARTLRLLPAGDPGGDPAIAEATLLTRAQAQARAGDPVGATQSLVLREKYLSGIVALNASRDVLWNLLQGATLDAGTMARAGTAAPLPRGWLELAALARRRAALADYEAWRQRYPRHPGEERLAALYVPDPQNAMTFTAPSAFDVGGAGATTAASAGSGAATLLLPQDGALLPLAEALRAGYLRAAEAAGIGAPRVLASSDYRQALAEGAGIIVGPLPKDALTAVAQGGPPPVPVLGLNYLDASQPSPPGLWQFGLAPEDEARAAAEDAASRGLLRALVMVPASDWGQRVQTAFAARLAELGGRVVDTGRYAGGPQAWSDPVRKLLRYVAINDRKALADARAKAGAEVDPQRRNDFDFVFLAGRASQARVLWPLFRYYHADRTPAYATAAINEATGDGDLAGIRFCDAPWLLEGAGPLQPLRDAALDGGRSREAARFYAFGADAQMLATRLARNELRAGDALPGATGLLAVGADGAVRRKLTCARMTNGGDPAVLPPPDSVAVPIVP